MSWLASFSRTNSSCAPLMLITGTQPLYAAPMPVTRFVTPGPSVAVTTAGRCKVRAKPYAMKAAPCSWRVRTKRISGVARSTSRIGRFIVPGMPNTWSMPSRLRQSTIACAPVIMKSPIRGSLSGKLGQQEVGLAPPAAVYRMRAAEARGWPVPRVVVQEPARAPLRPGLARPLEVLALERERDAVARRQRRAARPDLDVDLDDLARLELLRLVVRVPGLVRARALRIELPLRRAQPALRHRALGSTAEKNVTSLPFASKARSVAKRSMSFVLDDTKSFTLIGPANTSGRSSGGLLKVRPWPSAG